MYRFIILLCHLFLLKNDILFDRALTLADDIGLSDKGNKPKL